MATEMAEVSNRVNFGSWVGRLTCPEKSGQHEYPMISGLVRKKRYGIQCPENIGPASTWWCTDNIYDLENERWLLGDMIDHVGIYGSGVAEGLSAFSVGLVHCVSVIISSWNFQELLPLTKVMSMQEVKVRGQRSRSQRSWPHLAVSGL